MNESEHQRQIAETGGPVIPFLIDARTDKDATPAPEGPFENRRGFVRVAESGDDRRERKIGHGRRSGRGATRRHRRRDRIRANAEIGVNANLPQDAGELIDEVAHQRVAAVPLDDGEGLSACRCDDDVRKGRRQEAAPAVVKPVVVEGRVDLIAGEDDETAARFHELFEPSLRTGADPGDVREDDNVVSRQIGDFQLLFLDDREFVAADRAAGRMQGRAQQVDLVAVAVGARLSIHDEDGNGGYDLDGGDASVIECYTVGGFYPTYQMCFEIIGAFLTEDDLDRLANRLSGRQGGDEHGRQCVARGPQAEFDAVQVAVGVIGNGDLESCGDAGDNIGLCAVDVRDGDVHGSVV